MLLHLLLVIVGCDLLSGTPAPAEQNPMQTSTQFPHHQEESSESISFYKEPVEAREKPQAAQPVISISERVQVKPREKKDLGTLGYVLGILMVVIIIAIGSGIVVGYIYKRGRDLKQQHEQEVEERRIQRINLPLSAFLNPSCDVVDENNIEISSSHTNQDGAAPLMSCTGTPGA
ncbi:phosphoinositide-3-kinase-interacting protein 1 [Spea bombifrons]|uniref:phosphoinositide-3-kinase-interacting protein 1 n=1 Tax=Spea bombifrons TaxID=233779 RepID=UPI00234AFB5B|nr:phosphoinositide-3-kinase-interacting protein 1 [Spea bombifrons]